MNARPSKRRGARGQRRPRKMAYKPVNFYDSSTEADTSAGEAGTSTQPLPSMNMNSYAPQSTSRPGPRLQNTQKPALGNGTGGWGGFGMPSSAGAFGALGGAPGLGRPGQLSGFAQVMGGGSGQGPIDMSDFPSLSGPRPQQSGPNAASWNSSAIRQPSATQQSSQPPQRTPSAALSQQSIDLYDGPRSQQPPGDRTGSGDEFPPLGGQLNGEGRGPSNGFGSGYGSPDQQQPRTIGQQTQLPIRDSSSTFQQSQQLPIGQSTSQTHPSNGQAPQSTPGMKRYADMTESEKWGLPGLMAAFASRKQAESGGQVDDTLPPAMRSTIIMGHDLNSLGLDLDSPDPLYPTFTPFQAVGSTGSQFDFHDRHMVPDFTLPSAYTVTNVPPLSSRINAFSDETLFSVFYQHPRDILQELAAHELVNRDWRWHKVLRQWLQKDTRESNSGSALPLVDLTNGAPIGSQPIRKSERVEQGVYVFFDAVNWRRERRYLDLDYESLDPPRVAAVNGAGPALGGGPGRLMTHVNQQSGIGSSQVPSA